MPGKNIKKRRVQGTEEVQLYAESIVQTMRESLLVLDSNLRVRFANKSFYQSFHAKPSETEGVPLFDLEDKRWDIPELRSLLLDVLPENTDVDDVEVEMACPKSGRKVMLLNARRL